MGDESDVEVLDELAVAARDGDLASFEELVRRTHTDTFTLAVRLMGNEEDAADVTQEAYLRAWKGIRRFRGDARFTTWMYRITANTASNHRERRHRTGADALDEVAEPVDLAPERQPELVAESSEGMAALSAALDDLPPKLRDVVVLKDVYDLTHEAIAEELQISETAAKVRLHRGRKKLREELDAQEGRAAHAV